MVLIYTDSRNSGIGWDCPGGGNWERREVDKRKDHWLSVEMNGQTEKKEILEHLVKE